jgi:retron-type reverse transcriptase
VTIAVLNAIYEDLSYGFRPKRGQHDALDALVVGIPKVNFILDADIQSYFYAVNQDWLIRFLKHRINDPPRRHTGTQALQNRYNI